MTFFLLMAMMMLDPQSKELLDKFPPILIETQAPEVSRREMEAALPPSDIKLFSIKDLCIPGPHGEIPIRIYSPLGVGPFPVVVFLHGGGWVLGSINTGDGIARAIAANAKVIVVSVDYRLAPENPFPIPLNDAFAATLWTSQNIHKYEGVASELIVAGESAGGNLAAAVALMARDKRVPKMIAGQILINPVTRYAYYTDSYKTYGKEGYLLTQSMMEWFWKRYLSDPEEGKNYLASPLFAKDLTRLPPTLLITSHFDPLHDEGVEYGKRLQEAGVDVKLVDYPTFHGFLNHKELDLTKKGQAEIASFIKELFKL